MKQIIRIPVITLLIVLILAACRNSKTADDAAQSALPVVDTNGLAEYQRWKLQNELKEQQKEEHESTAKEVTSAPVVNKSNAKSSTSGRNNPVSNHSPSASQSSADRDEAYENSENSNSSQGAPVYNDPAPEPSGKKGMSHTAKGAIVGAASGAIIGAIANKKSRAGGAVVGGVIGGATGAGVGVVVDKKKKKQDSGK